MVMTKTSQYPYSLGFTVATIFLMLVLMMLIFPNITSVRGVTALLIYGFSLLIFLLFLALLVVKRLIPALKGDIALELDEDGISDYIRDISINWTDIKNISLVRGRSASMMKIDLKWESEYGQQIIIPLRWVKGKDDKIYENVLSYFTAHATRQGENGY